MGLELRSRRVLLTGGGGFLGSHILERLRLSGVTGIVAPRRRDYDLTSAEGVDRLFSTYHPEVVIHAAAAVGGIGANQASPGRLFYENALMGIQVIEACRRFEVEK